MENKLRRGLALLMTLIMLISCAPMDALAAIVPVSGGTQTSSGVSLKSIVKPPVATTTYVFMNGTEEFARQILKNGQTLNNPGTPTADSANKEFVGWFDESGNQLTFPITASVGSASSTITVNAQFVDVNFVFFTNPSGEVMVTKKGANGDTISTEGVTYPVGNEQFIIGWNYTGNEDDPLISEVKLEGKDVTLKAVVKDGHWITYDSQGGTYVAPAFVKGNGTTTAPAAPTRPGYTFHHWSETVGGAAFTFGNALTTALTLYAVWTANTNTRYTVIHWLENADDNEYSYKESETRTGATGAQTSAAAKSYTGFTVKNPIETKTIAGDGSTIVNVYYTRNVYTVKFYEYRWENWVENEDLRITAKHGANIRAKWPKNTFWYVNQNHGGWNGDNTAQSNLDTMPIGGKNFYGQVSGEGKAYYYVEVLPGESGEVSVGGKSYKLDHTDTGYTSGTVTDEERYEMTGFTCNVQYSAKNRDRYSGSKFYYDRNSYNVVYINSGSQAKATPYLYQKSIADAGNYELTDADAPAGKEGYVFAGWYDATEGGNKFVFTGKTMPAQNVTVYAKWNPPVFDGTIYLTIEGMDTPLEIKVKKGDTIKETLDAKQAEIMTKVGAGYTWRGWRTGSNGTGEPFNTDTQINASIILYPYYTKDGTFTVEYVSGKNDVTAPKDGKSYAEDSFADLMSPGKLVAADGEYFLGWSDGAATYQPRDKYQIKSNHANEQNVITLTAQWGARPAGTILTYKANGGAGADKVENLANNATVTTKPADTFSRAGYTFKGWDTDPKGEGSIKAGDSVQVDNNGANVLYAIWTANTDTKYTVEFYYQNTDGSYTLNHSEERKGTTDTTVSVTEADKAAKEDGKYVFEEGNANNVRSGVIAGEGTLVLKLYFKLNTAEYTIHHYLNGTTVKVADDETGTKTIGEKLTANKSDALYLAYAAAAEVVSYAPKQTIEIAADESKNVITVYYTVPLTITAKDASKTYDGHPLTQPAFTMEGLVNGDTKDNFSLSMTAESTITDAGNTPNVIDTDTVKYNGGAIPSYYNVSYEPGTLTVNKASATVTITGVNKTHVYDGTQHEANGYNYSFTGKPGQITISPKPNVLAIARRTDVGTTYMGLTMDSFTVTSANYDVTIKAVIDGYVTITPVTDKVTVTVTENGAIVTYDGTEHSVKGYKSMTADNALYDVTTSVKATETAAWTAKGKDAGEYPVGIVAGDFQNTNKNFTNVAFKIVDGVLKINPVADEVIVTVTENGATVTYDGTEHSVKGYKSMTADNKLYDVTTSVKATETAAWTAKGTDAGEYPVGIAAGDFENTNKNFTNVTFKVVDDVLKITPVTDEVIVTVTENGATVTYDGNEHSVKGYKSMTADNKLYDVTKSVKATETDAWTAKGKDAGEYPVGVAAGDFKNTNPNFTNVEFVIVDGKLTISPITDKVTVTITETNKTITYDGSEHSISGYTFIEADNRLYNLNKVAETRTDAWTAKGTDAGEYPVGIEANDFKNNDANFTNVEFVIVDGKLTISPITDKTITITANSGTKVYDGTPLTDALYNYTEGVLVNGDVLTAVVEGSQTDAGSSVNTVTSYKVMRGDKDVTGNYTFGESVMGTLTVSPRPVTITAQDYTVEYDGQPHGKNPTTAYVVAPAAQNSGLVNGHTESNVNIAFTATDAGTYTDKLVIDKDAVTIVDSSNNDVTGNYAIEVVPGTLTIEQYKDEVIVTITGNTQLFTYDCTEHTVQGFTATADNPLYNVNTDFTYDGKLYEAATLLAVAKGTNVGVYHMGLHSNHCVNLNKNFAEVTFEVQDGSLRIEKQSLVIEVANSSKVYGDQDPAFADATLRFYDKTGATIEPSADMKQELSAIDLTVRRSDAGDDTIGTHVDVLTISKTAEELREIYTNYNIGVNPGDFEITATEESLKVRADNYEGAYDGNGHGVVAKAYINGTTEAPSAVIRYYNEVTGQFDLTESPKFTDVKSDTPNDRIYTVRFQATLDGLTAEGSANVLISPRKLVLSSGTESKDYDGLPLTSQEVVIEDGRIINDQIYDLKATGSVTKVAEGKVTNTITYSTTDEYKPINYDIELVPGTLQIEKRDVSLTSETASKEYDGTPLTRPNVTEGLNGFVAGEVTDLRATGSVTYVDEGEVTNTITFTPTDKFDENNYNITKQEGKLSITAREGEGKTITVTTATNSKVYDGTALTDYNHTWTGELVTGDTLVVTYLNSSAQTNVGSCKNEIAGYRVVRKVDGADKDVTSSYTFGETIIGTLTVTPVEIELTANSDSKQYDGTALTNEGYKITKGAFVGDEGLASVTVEGSQTLVGESANTITAHTRKENTLAQNYNITYKPGTLTVTKNEKAITVTANSHTWEYDGQPHSDGGYTVEYDGQTYKVEAGKTATLSTGDVVQATVVGTVKKVADSAKDNNKVTTVVIKNAAGEDTKGHYETVTLIPGTLTITKRGAGEEKVKITAADNTVEYDGQPHGAKLNAANQIEVGTSFTVTNLAEGHSVKTLAIDGSETDAGVYANKLVPGNAVIVDGNGVEVTANYDITYVSGTLTITQRGSGDMKVVLTAANNTVVYDGQPHGAKLNAAGEIEAGTSYTITNLADGHKVQSVVISGSETAVGEYENRLVPSGAEIVDAAGNDVTRNYVVGYKNGKLTITSPDTVIVTIKGKTDTVEYDGQKHEVNGYEVVSISNTLYTEADFGFADGATAHAEGTDAGDYFMNLTKDSFVNRNANFSAVTFVVEDGKLTITRRGLDEENLVKIIAADNTVYYDGQPHGAKLNAAGQIEVNVSYTTEYLAPGHKVQSVVIDGSETMVGVYENKLVPKSAVIVDKTDKDVTENYEITYVRGTLEIRKNETEIKVTANNGEWVYDGKQHSDSGYTVTYGNESYTVKAGESATLSTGDKVTAVVKGQVKDVDDTKAGNNEIVEWSVEHRDFYNNVTPANGTLTITPRKVTLKSDGGSKPYDGTPLTKPEVAVTGDGFVAGEVSDIKATGSVTYVSQGEVDNLITFTKNEGFKDSNYEIEEIIGKLSIEALDVTIIITGPSAIREYKPGVTHTIVTGGSELDFVYGSDKVDGKIGVEGMVEGDKILPGTLKHTLEGMYVGEYEGVFTLFDSNGKKADKPTVMHEGVDVTENYKFSYNPGKLTITGKHMDGGKEVENEAPEKNYLLGQKIPFTITVRSVSKDELKDVTVTDPTATILPDRNTANPAYTVSEDEHTATITSLAPEAEVIVYAEHEVTEDDIINRYTNEATINWGNDEVKVSKTPSIEEENPEAELVKEIVLQDGQDENHKFKLGETVYFKITVTNTGNVTLNEYEVKEVLPGAAFIDGTGYTLNNDKTVATIEKMEPVKDGQEAPDSNQIVLYAQYTIKEEDLGNKELKNIVTADNSKPGEVPIPVDEAKSVSGQKIWKDEGNAFNTRPASITLTLMRKLGQNGAAEQYRTMQLGSNGSWRYSFDHLPKHDAQENEYFYWVVEEPVTGYDTAYETKDESHCDIVNNLQTYTLTIHYWQHKLGDTKMEQAFPDYVATLYYKQPYDVESPEREGIILDDMSQARISGTMPVHDLVIDVYYHRIAYRLTIHYIYQDGTMAHEDYTWTYWFNSTYNVPSPIIPGFTPSIDVIAGRMPSHGLELTVVYVGDGEIVIPDEDTSLGFKSYLNAGECFE